MSRDGLIESIRETFGRVVYTHKTHEKAADLFVQKSDYWKLIEVVLIAATTTGVISVLLGAGEQAQVITSILSAGSLLVSIYQYRFLPDQQITAHRICARNLWLIRERLAALLCDLNDYAISEADARVLRDQLTVELHKIYETAPQTTAEAYAAAQKALQKDEDMTFSDNEIDHFLPSSARKK